MWETPNQSVGFCGDGFWGIPDASVVFCEEKYIESYWVGEYYNTLSSLMYICVGIPFLFTKIAKTFKVSTHSKWGDCIYRC